MQPDYSSGCMLALYPPAELAAELALDGGLAPAGLHITIAYLGEAADVDLNALTTAAAALLDRPPVTAAISGHARFTGGPQDVIVALADSADIEDLRRDTIRVLAEAGIEIPRDHGYCPHMTLAYIDEDDPDPVGRLPARPAEFGALVVKHGKDRTSLPFRTAERDHPIAPLAMEAYMAGWAASGGPWTPRVLAGCHAAAAWAAGHADQPDVFEVTLKLGSLEGAWALVYQRRHDTIQDKTAPVMDTWRTLTRRLNARSLISKYRALAGLHGETADPHRRNRKAEATAAVLAWLLGILDDPSYDDLTAQIMDALQTGLAEGDVGARLIAAEEAGVPAGGLDTQVMFTDAYNAMRNLPSLPGMASEWAQRIIAGNAADLGQALASLLADGATYQDMLDTAMQITSGTDVRAVSLLMDYAISGAYARGALNLYASEGLTQVAWLSAGDERVCFPAGTPVVTPDGESLIETLKPGDLVLTPEGKHPVYAIMARPYSGTLAVLKVQGRTITATADHPFMTVCGWRPAGEIEAGDLLETLGNEYAEVDRVIHVTFCQTNNMPSGPLDLDIARFVSGGGPFVPVSAIGFQRDAEDRKREVYGPAADGELLHERDLQSCECLPDTGLQSGLTTESSVTGDVAELPVLTRALASCLTAGGAGVEDRRAAACLGAEVPVEALLGSEPGPAPFAIDVLGDGSPADAGTDRVPMGDGSLGDREGLATDRACLGNRVGSAGFVTQPGAERPTDIAAASRIEGLAATSTLPFAVDALPQAVAQGRAEDVYGVAPSWTHERFAALSAFVGERHPGGCHLYIAGVGLPVYDVAIEQAHVFYAGRVLVHNCDKCLANEAQGPYTPQQFPDCPAHVRCRCTPAPADPLPVSVFTPYLTGEG